MKNELVSIIVPIFNTEKYLDRCLKSLLQQTYKNIEIILINDGSTDSSLQICKKYVKHYKNIILIDSSNNGVSSARNQGIKKANGKYIVFVDSDDEITKDAVNIMYKKIQCEDVDVVISNYAIVNKDGTKKTNKNNKMIKYKDFLDFISYNMLWGPANKIVKRSKIKTLFDENISIGEDALFWCENFKNCKYSYIDTITYYYYMNDNSAMHEKKINNRNISFFTSLEKVINICEGSSKEFFMAHYIDNLYKYNSYMEDTEKIFKKVKYSYIINARRYMNLLNKSSNISMLRKIKLHIKLILIYVY